MQPKSGSYAPIGMSGSGQQSYSRPDMSRLESERLSAAGDHDAQIEPDDIIEDTQYFKQPFSVKDAKGLLDDLYNLHRLQKPQYLSDPRHPFSNQDLAQLLEALSYACREGDKGQRPPSPARVREVLHHLAGMNLAAGFWASTKKPNWKDECAWRTVMALHAMPNKEGDAILRRLCHFPDMSPLPKDIQEFDQPFKTFLEMATILIEKRPCLSAHPATLIEQVNSHRPQLNKIFPPDWLDSLSISQKIINYKDEDNKIFRKRPATDEELIALRKAKLKITEDKEQEIEDALRKIAIYIKRSAGKKSIPRKLWNRLKVALGGNKTPFEPLYFNGKLPSNASPEALRCELIDITRKMEVGSETIFGSESKGAVSADLVKLPLNKMPVRVMPILQENRSKAVSIGLAKLESSEKFTVTKRRAKEMKVGVNLVGGHGADLEKCVEAGIKASFGGAYRVETKSDELIGLNLSKSQKEKSDTIWYMTDDLNLVEFVKDLCREDHGGMSKLNFLLLKYANLFLSEEKSETKTKGVTMSARITGGIYSHRDGKENEFGIGASVALLGESMRTEKKKLEMRGHLKRETESFSTTTTLKVQGNLCADVRSYRPIEDDEKMVVGKFVPVDVNNNLKKKLQKEIYTKTTSQPDRIFTSRKGLDPNHPAQRAVASENVIKKNEGYMAAEKQKPVSSKTETDAIKNPFFKSLINALPLQASRENTMTTITYRKNTENEHKSVEEISVNEGAQIKPKKMSNKDRWKRKTIEEKRSIGKMQDKVNTN